MSSKKRLLDDQEHIHKKSKTQHDGKHTESQLDVFSVLEKIDELESYNKDEFKKIVETFNKQTDETVNIVLFGPEGSGKSRTCNQIVTDPKQLEGLYGSVPLPSESRAEGVTQTFIHLQKASQPDYSIVEVYCTEKEFYQRILDYIDPKYISKVNCRIVSGDVIVEEEHKKLLGKKLKVFSSSQLIEIRDYLSKFQSKDFKLLALNYLLVEGPFDIPEKIVIIDTPGIGLNKVSSEILSKEIYDSHYIYITTPIKNISNTIFDSLLRHMNLPNISKFPIILHTSEAPPTHSSHQHNNGNLHGYHKDLLDYLTKTIITVDPKAINEQSKKMEFFEKIKNEIKQNSYLRLLPMAKCSIFRIKSEVSIIAKALLEQWRKLKTEIFSQPLAFDYSNSDLKKKLISDIESYSQSQRSLSLEDRAPSWAHKSTIKEFAIRNTLLSRYKNLIGCEKYLHRIADRTPYGIYLKAAISFYVRVLLNDDINFSELRMSLENILNMVQLTDIDRTVIMIWGEFQKKVDIKLFYIEIFENVSNYIQSIIDRNNDINLLSDSMEKLSEHHHDNQCISTKQVQLPSNRDALNLMKDIISNINLSYPLHSDTVAIVMSGVIQIKDETSICMKVEYLQDKIIFKLSENLNKKIAEIVENSKILNEDHMETCFLIHQEIINLSIEEWLKAQSHLCIIIIPIDKLSEYEKLIENQLTKLNIILLAIPYDNASPKSILEVIKQFSITFKLKRWWILEGNFSGFKEYNKSDDEYTAVLPSTVWTWTQRVSKQVIGQMNLLALKALQENRTILMELLTHSEASTETIESVFNILSFQSKDMTEKQVEELGELSRFLIAHGLPEELRTLDSALHGLACLALDSVAEKHEKEATEEFFRPKKGHLVSKAVLVFTDSIKNIVFCSREDMMKETNQNGTFVSETKTLTSEIQGTMAKLQTDGNIDHIYIELNKETNVMKKSLSHINNLLDSLYFTQIVQCLFDCIKINHKEVAHIVKFIVQ